MDLPLKAAQALIQLSTNTEKASEGSLYACVTDCGSSIRANFTFTYKLQDPFNPLIILLAGNFYYSRGNYPSALGELLPIFIVVTHLLPKIK